MRAAHGMQMVRPPRLQLAPPGQVPFQDCLSPVSPMSPYSPVASAVKHQFKVVQPKVTYVLKAGMRASATTVVKSEPSKVDQRSARKSAIEYFRSSRKANEGVKKMRSEGSLVLGQPRKFPSLRTGGKPDWLKAVRRASTVLAAPVTGENQQVLAGAGAPKLGRQGLAKRRASSLGDAIEMKLAAAAAEASSQAASP